MTYKLIKEYPGSPVIGTVVTQEVSQESDYKVTFPAGSSYKFSDYEIESYPEYWQRVYEKVELKVDHMKDYMVIQAFRWGYAGGQHVNKASSAIRLSCEELKFNIECAQYRSQLQNRDKCLELFQLFLNGLDQSTKDYYINKFKDEQH